MLLKHTYTKELQELLSLSKDILVYLDHRTLVDLAALLQAKLNELGEFNIDSG